eukprot:653378-Prymnesium_polylepis.1
MRIHLRRGTTRNPLLRRQWDSGFYSGDGMTCHGSDRTGRAYSSICRMRVRSDARHGGTVRNGRECRGVRGASQNAPARA